MKSPTTRQQKQKQVLARLKVWLLQGKTITSNQALSMWKTSRLACYIHRLRKRGMTIYTEIIGKGPDQYALYYTRKRK